MKKAVVNSFLAETRVSWVAATLAVLALGTWSDCGAQERVRMRPGQARAYLAAVAAGQFPEYVGVEQATFAGDQANTRTQWTLEPTNSGSFRIRHAGSGQYLSAAGGEPSLATSGSGGETEWVLEPRSRNQFGATQTAYRLLNRASGRYFLGGEQYGMHASAANDFAYDWFVETTDGRVTTVSIPSAPDRGGIPNLPRGTPLSGPISGYFRLQTMAGEKTNQCLEGNAPERGPAFMTPCESYSGQLWKLTFLRAGEGRAWYRLQTQWQEQFDRCFEGNDPSRSLGHFGASFMTDCANYSGQSWMLTSGGNGYFQLTTAWVLNDGFNKCLEGNARVPGAAANGHSFLAPCGNFTGQFWKIVPG